MKRKGKWVGVANDTAGTISAWEQPDGSILIEGGTVNPWMAPALKGMTETACKIPSVRAPADLEPRPVTVHLYSPAERLDKVKELCAYGLTDEEIAWRLQVSVSTVRRDRRKLRIRKGRK